MHFYCQKHFYAKSIYYQIHFTVKCIIVAQERLWTWKSFLCSIDVQSVQGSEIYRKKDLALTSLLLVSVTNKNS
jgi:hypothetical protein